MGKWDLSRATQVTGQAWKMLSGRPSCGRQVCATEEGHNPWIAVSQGSKDVDDCVLGRDAGRIRRVRGRDQWKEAVVAMLQC